MPTLDQWIQIAVAIGTIGATVIALFGQPIRYFIGLRPKLRLRLLNDEGEFFPSLTPKLRYYHIKAWNDSQLFQATNVRVVISKIARPTADGSYKEEELIGPLQLLWRFSKYHTQFATIGHEEICDLGHITEKEFTFTTLVMPKDFLGNIESGQKARIELMAIADNAKSDPIYLEIAWNGNWSDDTIKMKNNLVIKEIKSI